MRWRVVCVVLTVTAVLAGCASTPSPPPNPPHSLEPAFEGAPTLQPPDMTNDGPGSLVDVKPLPASNFFDEVNATAVRVVYRSTSGDKGESTEVSGVVAIPPGNPPKGGWPILVFGHEMTGVANKCAPSLATDLAGYAAIMSVMMSRGYVVALPDYQGLGLVGQRHSIIDAATLGNNMIDAARAVRRVLPTASTRWAAFGAGEGGLAAWGATERAGTYGGGLDLVGAVALSPLTDISGLADAAENGTLIPDQYRLLIMLVEDLASTSPGFNADDYRAGLAKDRWDLLTDCAPPDAAEAVRTLSQLQAADLRPHTAAAAARLRQALSDAALPQNGPPPAAPLLVVSASEDPQIPIAWINRSLSRACSKGDPIEISKRIGDTTTKADPIMQFSLDWLQARFDGQRVANICRGIA